MRRSLFGLTFILALVLTLTGIPGVPPGAHTATAKPAVEASATVQYDNDAIYLTLSIPGYKVDLLKFNRKGHLEYHTKTAGLQVDLWVDLVGGGARVVVKADAPGKPVLLDANVKVGKK